MRTECFREQMDAGRRGCMGQGWQTNKGLDLATNMPNVYEWPYLWVGLAEGMEESNGPKGVSVRRGALLLFDSFQFVSA